MKRCNICKKKFKNAWGVTMHKAKAHKPRPGPPIDGVQKNFAEFEKGLTEYMGIPVQPKQPTPEEKINSKLITVIKILLEGYEL